MNKLLSSVIIFIVLFLLTIPFEGICAWDNDKPIEKITSDTIYITNNVLVGAGDSLVFNEGSVVLFTSHFMIEVKGRIVARGSAQSPILFTIDDTTGFTNPQFPRGAWNGFHFTETPADSDSSIFTYCNFSYTKALGDSLDKFGGVFNLRSFSKIRIEHCGFYNNYAWHWGGAIFGEHADIQLENCLFEHNSCGQAGPPYGYGGAICFRNSSPIIHECSFIENKSTGIGGGASFEYANAEVNGNLFLGNKSGLGGALGYMRSEPINPLVNNVFVQNGSVFFGEAIACIRSNPVFLHNSIVDNENDSFGGVFYCNDSACPTVINSILYNDSAPLGYEVYLWDNISLPMFTNCDIRGGKDAFGGTGSEGYAAAYNSNIDTMPELVNSGQYYGLITEASPCIDAGSIDFNLPGYPSTDFRGYARILGQAPDMGAFEYKSDLGIDEMANTNKMVCYPNPFSDFVTITLPESKNTEHLIQIFTISGQKIYEQTLPPGTKEFLWKGIDSGGNPVKKGVYLVKYFWQEKKYEAIILRGI
ncbi:MAG: choice-of-anchor Q domain-containing protein [Lentimicrobium sp.]|jgi:hypothetical protein|nr:choice-of-anchor Q domain-containing protein [Lentimicrobium sp.]